MLWIVCKLKPSFSVDAVAENGGYLLNNKERITEAFTNEETAINAAKAQAGKNPKVPYAILAVKYVFETKTPEIMEKVLNDRNELILAQREEAE